MKVFLCLLFFTACGNDPSGDEAPAPAPTAPAPAPAPDDFAKVKVVIDEQCANAGCHAGASFIQNAEAFKASSAKIRVANGSMPKTSGPNYGKFNNVKKNILLDFLK